jgi:hypothetical protein
LRWPALVNYFEWLNAELRAVNLQEPGALFSLVEEYGGARPDPLRQVLGQAYALGTQACVIEDRYLDYDYRNEHGRFYSTTYRQYPGVAHRLHFFADPPPAELINRDAPISFDGLGYYGYAVLRPIPGAPLGRTMIAPPRDLEDHVTCMASDQVNLLGSYLRVTAAPFMSQDAQLTVCAHTTAWVTAYYYHLAYGTSRFAPGDIACSVPSEVGLGRLTPATGLNVHQLCEAARRIGLPAIVYRPSALPRGESIYRICCRYLNSGLPVIVLAGQHAFVLVGYRYIEGDNGSQIQFIRQDDEVGPYQLVTSPFLDRYNPWKYLIVPLPEKVYLPGEKAEVLGEEYLRNALKHSKHVDAAGLLHDIESKTVQFRSRVMRSNDFKATLPIRKLPDLAVAAYQRIRMPRWVWVIEAVLYDEWKRGEDCVRAEAIIDATDHLRDLHVLAWRTPGELGSWLPEQNLVGLRTDLPPTGPSASVSLACRNSGAPRHQIGGGT